MRERVKNILVQPRGEWEVVAREPSTIGGLYRGYVAPLAAIGPIAATIGQSLVGVGVPGLGRYRVPLGGALVQAAVTYVLSLAAVYVLALVIDALAPRFEGRKDLEQAFKLAAYSSTAAWLAGVFALFPALGFLSMLGLYSLYLLYLGVPVVMKVPESRVLPYTAAVIVAAVVIFFVVAAIGGVLMPSPVAMPGPTPR
ncbi:MAG TPA: Yip1 family protein [Candidatus Binatia bacterium]|nr:Yip1 family protein [Candidatus Binatia bacterium]